MDFLRVQQKTTKTLKKRLDLSILSKVDNQFWQVGCHGGMKGDSIFSIPLLLDL